MHLLDTAFISSRGGWKYCDDQSIRDADPNQVVVSPLPPLPPELVLTVLQNQKAYVLFYKRSKA